MDSKESSKSWFCVLNNPQEIYTGEPCQIAEQCLEDWVKDNPTRTGAVAYCISADGLNHLHMVLEDSNKARFSALKNTYPKAHLEPTRGTKEQAEDYINKRGKFQEKDEKVLYIARYGEIKGNQGARKDFDVIEGLVEAGKTPKEIFAMNFSYRRYEKMIKQAYFDKRNKETPWKRGIVTYWHVGESGSGKSYVSKTLVDKQGEDALYMYTDYENGGLDGYNGEHILFMDEFRGQLKYSVLLGMLHGYKQQLHARYTNIVGLWDYVHITSVMPPEKVYTKMVTENQDLDRIEQLKRRIDYVVYHYRKDGEYKSFMIPMAEYTNYDDLKARANGEEIWWTEDETTELPA